jgi:SAM-dependent methyltransferase
VTYHRAAETVPELQEGSVDLVTVAQAVHWFDRPKFYAEVRRVLRPGGIVAVWTYGLSAISPEIDAVVRGVYRGLLGPYWPPERHHPETGYRELDFPFPEQPFPAAAMQCEWHLEEYAGYLRSWSAVARFIEDKGFDPIGPLASELKPLWGEGRRTVVWPLAGRLGRVG